MNTIACLYLAIIYLLIKLNTHTLAAALWASEAAHLDVMIAPKNFLEARLKYLMALGANITCMPVIMLAEDYSPGNSRAKPDCEKPPKAIRNPQDDGYPLEY